ncbi:MAG: hypothetical protein AAF415_03080 [Pseudomonadota bacterium]
MTQSNSGAIEFCDDQLKAGRDSGEVRGQLRSRYGLGDLGSKSVVIASSEFNVHVSKNLWAKMQKSAFLTDEQRANRFRRKFGLSHDEAAWLVGQFRAGKTDVLRDLCGFERLSKKMLTEAAQAELRREGLIE